MKQKFFDFIKVTFGCALYAFGLAVFLQPNEIAPGGFSGMAVIVNFVTSISTGNIIMVLNIPLMLIGFKKLGKYFMIVTIYNVVLSSLMVDFFIENISITTEPLLAAIYGGILIGIGLGFNFAVGGSTGGIDIITKLIRQKKPHLGIGQIMVIMDLVIISIGALVFENINSALYASISMWISSKLIDSVLEGPDLAKLVYIISNNNEQIAKEICSTLRRGATLLNGTGAYTQDEKTVIICAVRRQQIPQIKKIASSYDTNAFMIVTDVREVLGDGFKASST